MESPAARRCLIVRSNTMAITIRPYAIEDASEVKRITAGGFGPVSVEAAIDRRWAGASPLAWIERKWAVMQHDLASPQDCFVAEIDGQVAGYVTTTCNSATSVGRIPDLAVDSRFQGRGIGRALVEHALVHFRACGLRLARIETLAHNDVGQHLYLSLGFEEVARQIHYAKSLVTPAPERGAPAEPTPG